MSDFIPRNILDGLWDDILKLHWTFLETEESKVKIENRKKLEDCLKDILGIVQHDRKFYLHETANVLKQSIRDLEDFSAQKAIIAFDSISQYANNLFTKPWRKEFRILKMYSGFYRHEIKSNLLNAETLFEAMGYRRLSEDTLILDGPICPDQVTNVSRDAMIAYVELQIIKHIHTALDAVGLNFSWLDIYRHREKYPGSSSQAIKALAYSVEEKRLRSRQKAFIGDNYGYSDVQPSSNYFETNTRFCPAHCQCTEFQQVPIVQRHRQIAQPNDIYCVPEHHQQQSSRTTTNSVYGNMSYPAHFQHSQHRHNPGMTSDSEAFRLHQMSHSRSLEHYSEPANRNQNIYPQRHSFDHQQQGCTAHQYHHPHQMQQQQQQPHQHYYQHPNQPQQNCYENPYDFTDGNSLGGGSSTISYAAVPGASAAIVGASNDGLGFNCNLNSSSTYSHPYNYAGNRIPLPLNQFSVYDNIQSTNYNGAQEPIYAPTLDQHIYTSASKLQPNYITNTNVATGHNQISNIHGVQNSFLMKDSLQSQRSCQSEQLINFENPTMLPHTTLQPQQVDPLNQYRQNYETPKHIMDKHYNMSNIMKNPLPPPTTSPCQQHCVSGKHPTTDNINMYAKATPRENRKKNALNLHNYTYNSGERGDTTDMSYDSAKDLSCQETERYNLSSPTQFTKNEDTNDSFEYCNVKTNRQNNGSSKDLGENKEVLVQSLHLDSLNINKDTSASQNSSDEKKRSDNSDNESRSITQIRQLESNQKNRSLESDKYLLKNNANMEKTVSNTSSTNNIQNPKAAMGCNTQKVKPSLKQTNKTSKSTTKFNPNHHPNKTKPKTNDNKILPKTLNNNNNESLTNPSNGAMQRKKSPPSLVNITNNSSPTDSRNSTPHSTQIIVNSANEWSCSFCTYFNPKKERICEMCAHSKDFKPDSPIPTATSTGGTTIAQNTPTCA